MIDTDKLEEKLEEFMKEVESKDLSEKTKTTYITHARRFVLWVKGKNIFRD